MNSSEAPHRSVYVVLPAYNEASNVGAVLRALARTGEEAGMIFRVIVVDDGSRDSTADVVRSHASLLPIILLQHPSNLGLGIAIRDGLLKAVDLALEGDVIVTMDADDTHTPSAIVDMVRRIDQDCDVLVASRYQRGSKTIGVPLVRRILSRAGSLLVRVLFPIEGVRDFTCGYRAYRASVLRQAVDRYRAEFITQEGFQCMVDLLLKLRHMNLRFGEVPLVLRYDRKGGKSKMKVFRTACGTLFLLCRRRLGL